MGARLYHKVVQSFRLNFDSVYFWTDSAKVLRWLRMSSHLLKQFVQSRVSEITELTGESIWLYLNGKENPANLVCRGLDLNTLRVVLGGTVLHSYETFTYIHFKSPPYIPS